MFNIFIYFIYSVKVLNNNRLRNQNKSNIIENCKPEKNSSLLCKHNSCDSIIPKNNFKIKKRRSWKNYLFEDGYSFQDDVIEMYNKYKCNIFYNSAKNFKNIDDLCANEKLKSHLYIYDINNLFQNGIINKNQNHNVKHMKNDYLDLNFDEYYYRLKNIDSKRIPNNHLEIDLYYLKENKNIFIKSKAFIELFIILEQDLIDVLENAIKFCYKENNQLQNLLQQFKLSYQYEEKLFNFIKITNILLNTEFINLNYLNQEKLSYMKFILFSSHDKSFSSNNIFCFLNYKLKSFKLYLNTEKLTYNDIFNYNNIILNNITDKNIQLIYIIGLKKLFIEDLKCSLPRFIYVLSFLHIFLYEKKYFTIDWHEKLIKILYSPEKYYKISKIKKNLYNKVFKLIDNKLVYRLYFMINSEKTLNSLDYYNNLQKNKKHLFFINHLIDLIILTKIKLFKI